MVFVIELEVSTIFERKKRQCFCYN